MFKPLFNVFEIVCLKDPQNFIKEDFNLKYYDVYKFNSLNKFDRKT